MSLEPTDQPRPEPTTTVLVTGGAGFIGSTTVERLLAAGHTVICLDCFDPYYDPHLKYCNLAASRDSARFHLVESDIRDAGAVRETLRRYPVQYVLHLAARAGVRASLADPQLYYEVNVLGTLNLLECVKDCSLAHFVFASSSSVYGDSPRVPFQECDTDLFPVSPYGVTKRQSELTCYAYHHLYGIPITCLRYFTVYGPRQRPDMAIHRFVRMITRGEEIPLYGAGDTSRDYTYVDDIVDGTLRALFSPAPFEIFNVGGSSPVGLRAVVAVIEEALGMEARLRPGPPQPGDVRTTSADIRKAQAALGYHPRTPMAEGVRRFVAWYRETFEAQ